MSNFAGSVSTPFRHAVTTHLSRDTAAAAADDARRRGGAAQEAVPALSATAVVVEGSVHVGGEDTAVDARADEDARRAVGANKRAWRDATVVDSRAAADTSDMATGCALSRGANSGYLAPGKLC